MLDLLSQSSQKLIDADAALKAATWAGTSPLVKDSPGPRREGADGPERERLPPGRTTVDHGHARSGAATTTTTEPKSGSALGPPK